MKVEFFNCNNCGAPLKIIESQFVIKCKYCNSKFYLNQEFPAAVVLKPELNKEDAKNLILKALKHKEIAKNFLHNSFFEGAVLLYLPFFEIRGIKSGRIKPTSSNTWEYSYQSYDYLEKANDLNDLCIGFFNYSIVENSILKAKQISFNPIEMRKKGVILFPHEIESIKKINLNISDEIVEEHRRLIFFPIWEISYTYKGIIFKSYLSAIDGQIIKIHAIRNHKKKLLLSLVGITAISILLARSFKLIFIGLKFPSITIKIISTFLLLTFFPALIFLILMLLPYFWQLFAFAEEVKISNNNITESKFINYRENSFIHFGNRLKDKLSKIFIKK